MWKTILISVGVTLITNKFIQVIESYNKCNNCKNFENKSLIKNDRPTTPQPPVLPK